MKAFVVSGKAGLTNANSNTKPWREAIKEAVLSDDRSTIDGPVYIDLTFWLPKPTSAPKRVKYPAKKPDLDKLARAVLDALTEASVWTDDSRVVHLNASKRFASDTEKAGVFIVMSEIT